LQSCRVLRSPAGIGGGLKSTGSGCHSICVNPGTIPVEFEFHSAFHWNGIINLAGPCAKIDSSGIPGTVEEKYKLLLMNLSHLPLQISKLFKIDATTQQQCRQQ